MSAMSSPTLAEPRMLISRAALLNNVSVLRAAAPHAKVCAMIKANAYGHDAYLVADALVNFSGARGQEAPALVFCYQAAINKWAATIFCAQCRCLETMG